LTRQQDAAQAVHPADKAAAEPEGAAAAPDAPGHRQAPRGRPGGHRQNQGKGDSSLGLYRALGFGGDERWSNCVNAVAGGAHHPGGEHDGGAGDP
jgi:hypothetical protein